MKDYRIDLLKEYNELYRNWEQNNMLYNSLKFYQLFNCDVENSSLIIPLIKGTGLKNDIMTSWWKPTKWFLFRTTNGSRKELTKYLLEKIPRGLDISKLRISLSKIRYEDDSKEIGIDVVEAFMDFLKVIYSLGNMTSSARTTTGGALDNWDAKLFKMKKHYTDKEWKRYVEQNGFQDYFKDNIYSEIIPFWNYGQSNLSAASDEDWKEYFTKVKDRIEQRNKRYIEGIFQFRL